MASTQIQVLGSGCPTCEKLYKITEKAVEELGLGVEVEYVTDVQKIIQMGLMQSPVLVVNGAPIMVGFTSDMEKLKRIIQSSL